MSNNDYNIDSLDGYEGAQAIRKRPASMLGSGGLDGAKHTFIEIVGNALDEVSSGYCDRLVVKYDRNDGSLVVRDYGRGVPMTWSEKKQTYGWDLVYNRLYSGGKLEDPKTRLIGFEDWSKFSFKDFSYLASVGLNGVGAACSQFTSEFFRVISYRDGKEYEMYFEKGYPAWKEMKVREQSEENGTYIHWKPDSDVFSDTNITFSWIKQNCEGISYVSGVDVHLFDGDKEYVYKASNIKEHLESQLKSQVVEATYLHHEDEKDSDGNVTGVLVCEANVAMGGKGAGQRFYNNQIKVQGGVHSEYSNFAVTRFFTEKAKERGVKITGSDVFSQYSLIITTLANEKSYRGQTKDSIDNEYIGKAIAYAVTRLLQDSWLREEQWVKNILESSIIAAQVREAAKAAEVQIKEASTKINKKVMPNGLISCEAMLDGNYDQVELYIVEGRSAEGSAKDGRDRRFQAIFPIRGKSLNTEKASVADALDNKETTELLSIIGAGMTVEQEGYDLFDISKLRVGKVVILTDADADGKHIQSLLITFFNKFTSPLLHNGHVYIANPPKYRANGRYYYSEEEFQEAKNKGLVGSEFVRYKGLGQMDAEELWNTTLNPETRKLTQVKVSPNDFEFASAISVIAGADTSIRKEFVLDALLEGYDNYEDAIDVLKGVYEEMDYEENLEIEEIHYD